MENIARIFAAGHIGDCSTVGDAFMGHRTFFGVQRSDPVTDNPRLDDRPWRPDAGRKTEFDPRVQLTPGF